MLMSFVFPQRTFSTTGRILTVVLILPVVLKVLCGKTKLMSIRQGKNYKIAAFVEKKLVTAEEGKE